MAKSRAQLTQLESEGSGLQHYVAALKSENRKLQHQISRLQAQVLTKQHRIIALESEMKKLTKKHGITYTINIPSGQNPTQVP